MTFAQENIISLPSTERTEQPFKGPCLSFPRVEFQKPPSLWSLVFVRRPHKIPVSMLRERTSASCTRFTDDISCRSRLSRNFYWTSPSTDREKGTRRKRKRRRSKWRNRKRRGEQRTRQKSPSMSVSSISHQEPTLSIKKTRWIGLVG